MRIEFDEEKRRRTLTYRDLDFADAAALFDTTVLEMRDDREDYGEVRIQTIGYIGGRLVMVVWTPRGEVRRIISMRKCNAREQAKYGRQLGGPG
jgi:uncharacterized DUF497 family protein